MRGTCLGQVHMDALCDQQPNLTNVNSDMTVSRDPGEAETQQACTATCIFTACQDRVRATQHTCVWCPLSTPLYLVQILRRTQALYRLSAWYTTSRNGQIYQQPYKHWPSLSPAYGIDHRINPRTFKVRFSICFAT